MALLAVRYRIEDNGLYRPRYDSVREAIAKQAGLGPRFVEMTSVEFFRSERSAGDIASSIVTESQFDWAKDSLLVVDITHETHAPRGQFMDPSVLDRLFGARSESSNMLGGIFGIR